MIDGQVTRKGFAPNTFAPKAFAPKAFAPKSLCTGREGRASFAERDANTG
jgi:hypothetical protein